MKGITVFYQEDHVCYSLRDNEIYEEQAHERDLKNYKYFELYKGYTCDVQGLRNFKNDLMQWSNELNNLHKIDYTNYYKNSDAVYFTFLKYSTNLLKKYLKIKDIKHLNAPSEKDDIETIKIKNSIAIVKTEFNYFERCGNSGLMTIDDSIKNKEIDCFGYDCPAFYPHLLGSDKFDLKIPICNGTESKISNFKAKLKYGIYECKITCNDKNFKKLFMFNEENCYTHYSLNLCLKYKKRFNIQLEILNLDKETNCYVYEEKNLINTNLLFGEWFKILIQIKKDLPDNKLVKHLLSSVWGSLCQFKRTFIHDITELQKMDVSFIKNTDQQTKYKILDNYQRFDENSDEWIYSYAVLDVESPYKINLRIKPFLTSYARKCFAEMIIDTVSNLDDIVRIHTDSVILRKDYDFTNLKYFPIADKKITGKISWKNVIDRNK